MPHRSAPLVLCLLASCAAPELDLPELDRAERDAAPRLLPLSEVVEGARTETRIGPGDTGALAARAEGLRARAAALRRSALSAGERDRMRAAQARLTGK